MRNRPLGRQDAWRLVLVSLGLFLSACDRGSAPPAPATAPAGPAATGAAAASPDTRTRVRQIIAASVKRPVQDVQPGVSFAQLGADQLALVEIVMEVEHALGIKIPDAAIDRAATQRPAKQHPGLLQRLTVEAFTDVVLDVQRGK